MRMVSAMGVFYVLPSVLLYTLHAEIPDPDDHRRDQGLSCSVARVRMARSSWSGHQALGRGRRASSPPIARDRGRRVRGHARALRAAASRRRCSCSPASIAPTGGEIRFDGAVVNEVEARDRNVGIVFQSYALYPHMTVAPNILFPAALQAASAQEKDRRRAEAAALVQVEEPARPPAGPAVGRPAAARGACPRAGQGAAAPPARRAAVQPRRLAPPDDAQRDPRVCSASTGVTTILVTHDQIEATTMADRIVCMSNGRIEQIGTADELYQPPRQRCSWRASSARRRSI